MPIDGDYDQPAIPLQGVGFNGDANGLIHSDGVNVILDSGTFVNFLPEWLTSRIYDAVGVRYNNATGEAVIGKFPIQRIRNPRSTQSGPYSLW